MWWWQHTQKQTFWYITSRFVSVEPTPIKYIPKILVPTWCNSNRDYFVFLVCLSCSTLTICSFWPYHSYTFLKNAFCTCLRALCCAVVAECEYMYVVQRPSPPDCQVHFYLDPGCAYGHHCVTLLSLPNLIKPAPQISIARTTNIS